MKTLEEKKQNVTWSRMAPLVAILMSTLLSACVSSPPTLTHEERLLRERQYFDQLTSTTDQSDPNQLEALANAYFDASYIPKDEAYRKGVDYLRLAVDMDTTQESIAPSIFTTLALKDLGMMDGKPLDDEMTWAGLRGQNLDVQIQYLERAIELDSRKAELILAELKLHGVGIETDKEFYISTKLSLYDEFKTKKSLKDTLMVLLHGVDGLHEPEPERGFEILEAYRSKQDPNATYLLARLYYQLDEYQDLEKAVSLLNEAAAFGSSDAMEELGDLHESGVDGVLKPSLQKQIQWYREAAVRGNKRCMVLIAMHYSEQGINRNDHNLMAEGIAWTRISMMVFPENSDTYTRLNRMMMTWINTGSLFVNKLDGMSTERVNHYRNKYYDDLP